MSVIVVGGRRYAAGLYWLGRTGRVGTARAARRLGRPWCVHHGERTGFAADELVGSSGGFSPAGPGPAGFDPEGLPALALALQTSIPGDFWMALVEGDTDAGEPGRGPFALVKARGGAILADGDEAFDDRAAALAAFERARDLGWTLFASPGLVDGLGGSGAGIEALDPAALDEAATQAGTAILLQRAAPSRRPARRLIAAGAGLAALAAAGLLWIERDLLVDWLAAPETVPAPQRTPVQVAVAVDGAALVAACREALIANPPFMPAWEIERIVCDSRFADPALAALRPELAGVPVLVVRWRLVRSHAEALNRRLAERQLARWHAGAVADGQAWAAAVLAPVLQPTQAATPTFLELRQAVDRAFGAHAGRIRFARDDGGGWTVGIEDAGPLGRLAPLVDRSAGLEITRLWRGGAGGWRLEGRPTAPVTMTETELRSLGIDPGVTRGGDARAGLLPGEGGTQPMEARDGTVGGT